MKVTRESADALASIADSMRADGFDADGDGVWYAARVGNAVVGAARARDISGIMLVDDVWVLPDMRGLGVGTALMDAIHAEHDDLWLICDEPEAFFYERCGYGRVSELPDALIAHWAGTGDWPDPADHRHVPMRRGG